MFDSVAKKEIEDTKKLLLAEHLKLPKNKLVVSTAGNVSQRLKSADMFLIKASGIEYDDLTPDSMILCDLNGKKVLGDFNPSSDTLTHAYIYRNMPDVFGVVHTHSTFATAWSAVGIPIPAILTMMGDEFGGDVPIGPFALIGDEEIGKGIVDTLKKSNSPAVLMQNHGPFTIGRKNGAKDAVKAAIMVEEVAKTVFIAQKLGKTIPIDKDDIKKLYDRYQNVYGQEK